MTHGDGRDPDRCATEYELATAAARACVEHLAAAVDAGPMLLGQESVLPALVLINDLDAAARAARLLAGTLSPEDLLVAGAGR
jgi:hypothetical protein